jgi:hypothetical protein
LGIYVVAPGENSYFAALAVSGAIPDLHLLATGQFFPRYRYEKNESDANQLGAFDTGDEWTRIDNVTDEALASYRATYPDADVSKDDIFDYVYGILHSPEYRTRFAADLKKMLPRIPKARDFVAFRDAGRELGRLHMDYESVPPHPDLVVSSTSTTGGEPNLLVTKMRYAGKRPNLDKTTIVYNDDITISSIPAEAHEYLLGSRCGARLDSRALPGGGRQGQPDQERPERLGDRAREPAVHPRPDRQHRDREHRDGADREGVAGTGDTRRSVMLVTISHRRLRALRPPEHPRARCLRSATTRPTRSCIAPQVPCRPYAQSTATNKWRGLYPPRPASRGDAPPTT